MSNWALTIPAFSISCFADSLAASSAFLAASSAAFNLEIMAFYVMNSFNQACTTFVGQNHGAGQNERCRLVLRDCLILNFIFTATISISILLCGRTLLGLFNPSPDVIESGMIRLRYIFFAYTFSFVQEVLSGYLRGFGISTIPAVSTVIGVCGTRLLWIFIVFPFRPAFSTIMQVYPLSLGLTAIVMLIFTLAIRPSKRFENQREL